MSEQKKMIGVPMDMDMYESFKALAKRDHRSVAGQIRYLVADYLHLEEANNDIDKPATGWQ